jgi:CheY-like chemotaxis protein
MQQVSNILLVDNDPMSNSINKKILQTSSFPLKICTYLNAHDALNYLDKLIDKNENQFPEVVFLDINMPHMDGWQFLEQFNKYPSHILKRSSVIILSASIDDDDIEKSKEYKIVLNYISKPLTLDKL